MPPFFRILDQKAEHFLKIFPMVCNTDFVEQQKLSNLNTKKMFFNKAHQRSTKTAFWIIFHLKAKLFNFCLKKNRLYDLY